MGDCVNFLTFGPVCSGHGQCVNGLCVCDAGWSGKADWVNTEGIDCSTSEIGTRVLWGLNLVLVLYIWGSNFDVVWARTAVQLEHRRSAQGYSFTSNKGLMATLSVFTVTMISQLTFAILKLINPNIHVGFDIGPTILFGTGKLGFYVAVMFYQPSLLQAILSGKGNSDAINRLLRLNRRINYGVQTIAILIGFIPLMFFGVFTDLTSQITLARAYYFIQGCSLLVNSAFAAFLKGRVEKALSSSASMANDEKSKEKMLRLKDKINGVQNTVMKQGFIQGSLYLAFGAWIFLINKHDYFLPISWLTMPILGGKSAKAVSLDKYQDKSLMKRFKKYRVQDATGLSSEKTTSEKGTATNTKDGGGSLTMFSNFGVSSTVEYENEAKEDFNRLSQIAEAVNSKEGTA